MCDEIEIKTEDENNTVLFKKKQRKNLRQRRQSNDDDHTEVGASELTTLEEIKEKQKLRQRPNGVSIAGLAMGKKLALEEETMKGQFNAKTGGLVNMTALKSGKMKEPEDAYDVGIGTQFSAETNKRDEDEEMMKYIELELQKRKGVADTDDAQEVDPKKYLTPEEAALYSLPDHLRQSSSNRSEEMLSNQMLNGIPEVDLGIQAKIKNIEATEDAKQKLLQDQKNKKDGPSQFVPTNMAVNFMQHNRFNIEDNSDPRRRRKEAAPTSSAGSSAGEHQKPKSQHQVGPNGVKRATDDYHYDKFKKQFRRY